MRFSVNVRKTICICCRHARSYTRQCAKGEGVVYLGSSLFLNSGLENLLFSCTEQGLMINSRSFMVNKGGESTTSGDAFFFFDIVCDCWENHNCFR